MLGAAAEAKYKKLKNRLRAEAIEKGEEFQARIDSQGGVFLLKGLYHGERRVRATDDEGGWELCDDEVDLISSIGRKTIKDNANPVDLRNKWGLKERKEYAPVKAVIDGEYARIVRADEWGEACELANLSFMERLKLALPSSMMEWLFVCLLPHIAVLTIAQKYVSSFMWFCISSASLIAMFIVLALFPGSTGFDGVPDLLNIIINFYLFIPLLFVFVASFIAGLSP